MDFTTKRKNKIKHLYLLKFLNGANYSCHITLLAFCFKFFNKNDFSTESKCNTHGINMMTKSNKMVNEYKKKKKEKKREALYGEYQNQTGNFFVPSAWNFPSNPTKRPSPFLTLLGLAFCTFA